MELGRRVAGRLRRRGIDATVLGAEQVTSLGKYDVVILGSAVYANKMMPAMTGLIYRWSDQLAKRPTYLFCSGQLRYSPPGLVSVPPDARELARLSGIRSPRMFGGAMWFDRLRPTERATMRMWGTEPGDYRNWGEVDAWADQVADDVLGAGAGADTGADPEP
jgi:menaquinone-dependent protoporphyrinogen oxidase